MSAQELFIDQKIFHAPGGRALLCRPVFTFLGCDKPWKRFCWIPVSAASGCKKTLDISGLHVYNVHKTEYDKGIDEEEYVRLDAQRGNGRCKFP